MAENKLHQATTNKTTTSIATTTGSNSRRMREAAPPGRNKKTLLTVNTAENRAAPPIHNNSKVVKKRDDAISLSSMSKEQKEDDSAYMVRREQQQQTRSRRSRGATPPRPKGIVRTRSHDGSLEPPPRGGAGGVAPRRRSASPNRIPRVPNKPPATAGATATVLASAGDANSTGNNSSPRRLSHTSKDPSSHSLATSGGGSSTGGKQSKSSWQWNPQNTEKNNQEQQLFEQRLCEDAYGVAVRKINQNGKPNLRYVRCLYADTLDNDSTTVGDPSSNRSTGGSSFVRSFRNIKSSSTSNIVSNTAAVRSTNKSRSTSNTVSNTATAGSPNTLTDTAPKRVRVLTWGKKKDVRISLDKFVCVRKGKTTDRARRNANPSCRILSLITTDPNHPSLDIEAPTRLDRDKFARAFARFLDVPLVGEDKTAQSVSPRPSQLSMYKKEGSKTAMSEPDMAPTPKQTIAEAKRIQQQQLQQTNKAPNKAPLPVVTMGGNSNNDIDTSSGGAMIRRHSNPEQQQLPVKHTVESAAGSSSYNPSSHIPDTFRPQVQIASLPDSLRDSERSSTQAATASRPTHNAGEEGDVPHHNLPHYHDDVGDASQVSSLTGIGFDQEIVEELHQALTELKAELEESRAEAARAVKVAEQAIQSAENSNSNDWNSTVTHKAAEAAALAQKRSAEAMAKARLAEERLEGERKTAAFWRRQAEAAEEEAGALQTRAAAAEVQRAAMEEELDSERRKTTALLNSMKSRYASAEQQQKVALEAALERNRTLELELEASRQELSAKNDETVSVS